MKINLKIYILTAFLLNTFSAFAQSEDRSEFLDFVTEGIASIEKKAPSRKKWVFFGSIFNQGDSPFRPIPVNPAYTPIQGKWEMPTSEGSTSHILVHINGSRYKGGHSNIFYQNQYWSISPKGSISNLDYTGITDEIIGESHNKTYGTSCAFVYLPDEDKLKIYRFDKNGKKTSEQIYNKRNEPFPKKPQTPEVEVPPFLNNLFNAQGAWMVAKVMFVKIENSDVRIWSKMGPNHRDKILTPVLDNIDIQQPFFEVLDEEEQIKYSITTKLISKKKVILRVTQTNLITGKTIAQSETVHISVSKAKTQKRRYLHQTQKNDDTKKEEKKLQRPLFRVK